MLTNIISNKKINQTKLKHAKEIILELQEELKTHIQNGSGPFLAAVYDEHYNLITKTSNSVIKDMCSHNHAEMNAIKEVETILNTYDLSSYNLKLFVTAEPCMMCLGGIMWSGIKEIYYGVPSSVVEEITGFDEGFKPNWLEEFNKRDITVYGNIAPQKGIELLKYYIASNKTIYKPQR